LKRATVVTGYARATMLSTASSCVGMSKCSQVEPEGLKQSRAAHEVDVTRGGMAAEHVEVLDFAGAHVGQQLVPSQRLQGWG